MKTQQEPSAADTAQHTPGPWRVIPATMSHFLIESAGAIVAEIPKTTTAPASFTECEANARLLAAAPEMLAALKELHAWAITVSDGKAFNEEELCVTRAAIAKATGQA